MYNARLDPPKNLGHISELKMVSDLVQSPVPNHPRGHIPNYRLVLEKQTYTLTHVIEYEGLY